MVYIQEVYSPGTMVGVYTRVPWWVCPYPYHGGYARITILTVRDRNITAEAGMSPCAEVPPRGCFT